MDDSWRFRPLQDHLCPVCSIPHFPFCPMPPPPLHAFDRYRPAPDDFCRFPPGHAPLFTNEPPLRDHRAPPPMPYPPEPWGVNHAPEREPFRPFFHPPQRFLQDDFLGGESSYKRMRVKEPPMGVLHHPPTYDRYEFVSGRISADDERRLNLIRDHGKQSAGEGSLQYHGEFLSDRFVRDVPQNQYRDVKADHGFDDPRINSVGRNGPILPPEPTIGHQNQFLRPNSFEEHQNFPGASSQGVERLVSHERSDFERVGAYNAHLSDYRNAHYERKDFDRSSVIGDYPNVRNVHSDVYFQRYNSHRDGGSMANSEYSEAITDEPPFFMKGQQAAFHMPDYLSRGKLEGHDRRDYEELHLSKDSSYSLPKQPQYSDLESYHLARDAVGYEQKISHPAFGEPTENRFEHPSQQTEMIQVPSETKPQIANDIHRPLKPVNYPMVEQSNAKNHVVEAAVPPLPGTNNSNGMTKEMHSWIHTPGLYPSLLPPTFPAGHLEASLKHIPVTSSTSVPPPTLFPVLATSAITSHPSNRPFPDPHALSQPSSYSEQPPHPSTEIDNEDIHQASLKKYQGVPKVSMDHSRKIKPTIIDASHLFKQPYRASRPDHIVIILRGLPGSGKSYLAKALRDLEIENGGNAPRIHAMDDYFMIEVEKKVDENEGSKSSSSSRVKKQTTKKVIEYCYEPEMEEAYRLSMLKAFKKTLEEGIFTFIIVDDRNLRVADFAQFWAIAKRSGYEAYLLEAPYKDPTGCAARNVHGFTLEDIQKMAKEWEEAPPLYLQLGIQSLFRGDDLNEHSIQEIDMDINDSDCDDDGTKLQNEECLEPSEPESVDYVPDEGSLKGGERWDSEEEEEQTRVKELGSSKWSKDLEEDTENSEGARRNLSVLSGLIQAYSKNGKSVHWGDQVDKSGFSISAMKKQSSLIIGPGSGYNLASNPLVEEQDTKEATESSSLSESKRQFSEKLRAEHESFRAVFNKRRQRIGGFFNTEDD